VLCSRWSIAEPLGHQQARAPWAADAKKPEGLEPKIHPLPMDTPKSACMSPPCGARLVHDDSPASQRDDDEAGKERFVPSEDGTEITDRKTGLVWRRCAERMDWNNDTQTCDGTPTVFRWRELLKHAKAERVGGWRIPNIKELTSIVDFKKINPALDPVAFPNVGIETYLSTTLRRPGLTDERLLGRHLPRRGSPAAGHAAASDFQPAVGTARPRVRSLAT
jgi:hypothetical protein